MRRKLVAGNWKSNGSLASNSGLLERLRRELSSSVRAEYAVCVPYVYLAQTQKLLAGSVLTWGAQDVSEFGPGAYTGRITAAMLLEFGCSYAIVGHSERRSLFGDSDAAVALKFEAALAAGLVPILCVGETLAERESGVTEDRVAAQLNAVIDKVGAHSLARAVIAYEPVWAIGTGKTATPEQAQSVHAYIRRLVVDRAPETAGEVRILYGGSVKGSNAAQLFTMPDIDGGLIGGASLIGDEFIAICAAAGAA